MPLGSVSSRLTSGASRTTGEKGAAAARLKDATTASVKRMMVDIPGWFQVRLGNEAGYLGGDRSCYTHFLRVRPGLIRQTLLGGSGRLTLFTFTRKNVRPGAKIWSFPPGCGDICIPHIHAAPCCSSTPEFSPRGQILITSPAVEPEGKQRRCPIGGCTKGGGYRACGQVQVHTSVSQGTRRHFAWRERRE